VDMCIDADAGSKAFSDAEVEGGDFGSHSWVGEQLLSILWETFL
jgi:hypothetical protein